MSTAEALNNLKQEDASSVSSEMTIHDSPEAVSKALQEMSKESNVPDISVDIEKFQNILKGINRSRAKAIDELNVIQLEARRLSELHQQKQVEIEQYNVKEAAIRAGIRMMEDYGLKI